MSVVNNNSDGPLLPQSSIIPTNNLAIQAAMVMELRAIRIILAAAYGMPDSLAGLQQSMTTNDLNNLS